MVIMEYWGKRLKVRWIKGFGDFEICPYSKRKGYVGSFRVNPRLLLNGIIRAKSQLWANTSLELLHKGTFLYWDIQMSGKEWLLDIIESLFKRNHAAFKQGFNDIGRYNSMAKNDWFMAARWMAFTEVHGLLLYLLVKLIKLDIALIISSEIGLDCHLDRRLDCHFEE